MHDLNDLYYFAQVAEHGSFTAAAQALGLPKSTLSRRISRLEEQLDIRLIHRTTRRLTLTDIGRAYLAHCKGVLDAAEAANAVVQQVQGEPRGKVVVSCPMPLSATLLARAIPEFMARYPKVVVELEATNRRVDLMSEGVDVAIRVRLAIDDSSLVLRRLGTSHADLVASPALIAELGVPQHPVDLARFPSLSQRFSDGRYRLPLTGPEGEEMAVSLTPRLMTDDMWVLRDAAVAGAGIVVLPRSICHEQLASGELALLLPDWRLPLGQIHAVYLHRRGLLPAVRHFIDFLVERLPRLGQDLGVMCPGNEP